MTISVGAATARDACTTRAVLLRDADRALYRAKGGGRDRVYHPEVGTRHAECGMKVWAGQPPWGDSCRILRFASV